MAKKYSFEDFVEKVNKINDNIDLSEFKYVNTITKGICKCKKCGNVWETRPDVLLRGHGCKKCFALKISENKKISFSKIQKRITKINSFLKLDEKSYVDTKHKCITLCDKCGYRWEVKINDLLNGHGCPQCYKNERKNNFKKVRTKQIIKSNYNQLKIKDKTDRFIKKLKEKYGDLFGYEKCVYTKKDNKVELFCKKHNHWFLVLPKSHLVQKFGGCDKCYQEHQEFVSNSRKMTIEKWKEKCIKNFNGKYSYELVTNINNFSIDKVSIICPIHGVFEIGAKAHYSDGTQCPKCTGHIPLSKEELIEKCRLVHGLKYDYQFLENKLYLKKEFIEINCLKHGLFKQKIIEHLDGCGCPKCRTSHLEQQVMNLLEKNKINYVYQAKFDWLGRQSLDFYLSDYNIAIECQGSQHFFDAKLFKNNVEYIKKRDENKRILCKENNVNLIYFLDNKYNKYIEHLENKYFNTVDDLSKYLKRFFNY